MTKNKFELADANVSSLTIDELSLINGGDNMFYDAGVATGVAIVQFCRWFGAVCEENKETQLYS